MHTRITQLISDLPDQIRARIALMDDSVVVSDEIQGNMAFINFASNLAVQVWRNGYTYSGYGNACTHTIPCAWAVT